MIKRMMQFDKKDWKHMRFLFKNLFIQVFIKFDWHETKDTYFFIKLHLYCDSTYVGDDK